MPLLTLSLFGGFDCRSAEGRPLTLSTHKARALLAYLAVHAGQRHPRDKLASFLWGDHPEVQARANLRKALSRLRQALPVPARRRVEFDAGGLMVPAGLLQVNVTRFETLARWRARRRVSSAPRACTAGRSWYAGMIGIALFGARLHEETIETMAPAPEAFCSAPAFLAAAYAHLGRAAESTPYRATVYRHYRLARREFAEGTSCLTWLLGIDPFRLAADVDYYAEGLRKAGFE